MSCEEKISIIDLLKHRRIWIYGIGVVGYYPDGTRAADIYDYDNHYMEDGGLI